MDGWGKGGRGVDEGWQVVGKMGQPDGSCDILLIIPRTLSFERRRISPRNHPPTLRPFLTFILHLIILISVLKNFIILFFSLLN